MDPHDGSRGSVRTARGPSYPLALSPTALHVGTQQEAHQTLLLDSSPQSSRPTSTCLLWITWSQVRRPSNRIKPEADTVTLA